MRDVVALAELVVKPWVRVPGGGGTDRMCVTERAGRTVTRAKRHGRHLRRREVRASDRGSEWAMMRRSDACDADQARRCGM